MTDNGSLRHPPIKTPCGRTRNSSFTEMFVLSCQARGYRYANISAAWRRWLLEPKGKPLAPTKPTACPTPHGRNGWQAQVSAHNAAVLAEVDQRIAARRTLRIFSEENQA
jgi:hypothetical protein